MQFLVLQPTGTFAIQTDPLPEAVRVPLDDPERIDAFLPFFELVYFHGIYTAQFRKDRSSGRKPVAYKLLPPDPWLLALAAVMWEGIVQGMAWDAVKVMCRAGLASMQRLRVAPPPVAPAEAAPAETITRRTARFRWSSFSSSGRSQYELFLDLKRHYKTLPPAQREQLSSTLRSEPATLTTPPVATRRPRRKA